MSRDKRPARCSAGSGKLVSLTLLLVFGVAIGGCKTVTIFTETGQETDSKAWRTEGRRRWTWFGAPVGQQPVDLYFRSQEACENFRRANPTFTRPDEVCRLVYGTWGTMKTLAR